MPSEALTPAGMGMEGGGVGAQVGWAVAVASGEMEGEDNGALSPGSTSSSASEAPLAQDVNGHMKSGTGCVGVVPFFQPKSEKQRGKGREKDRERGREKEREKDREKEKDRGDGNQGFNPGPGTSQVTQGELPNNYNLTSVWAGSLNWSGTDSTSMKEVYVVARSQNRDAASCHASTWPRSLTLEPTQQSLVPNTDLFTWIKHHEPVICTFMPNSDKTNQINFHTLVQLITKKNIYAMAGWRTPSGSQDNNVLLFPWSGRSLVGAFFPLTGIPEMPKIVAMPIPSMVDTKTEEFPDPLGLWKEVDDGEDAYYKTDAWKWDSPMPSLEPPWAIFNS